jgi:RHS repeat-associated protein
MSDLLGTARGLIAPNNVPTDAAVYTAFGERISGTNHRFGYVGSFGYQASGEYPFLHLGARYYDPATGRFLQRDPIGIAGGANVYEYVRSRPVLYIDPEGLGPIGKKIGGAVGTAGGAIAGGLLCLLITKNPWAVLGAGAAGGYVGEGVGEDVGGWIGDQVGPEGPINDDSSLDITLPPPPPPPHDPHIPPPGLPIPPRGPVFERPWWERN